MPHFITDPDDLLNGPSGYLMDVLTRADPRDESSRAWRLLILEDAGELLGIDAHERARQALGRLLNVTDGFMGQGTNALVLITTNERIDMLHPAVSRPGRCLSEIEFEALSVEAANTWLQARDCAERVQSATTLAELFAIRDGKAKPRPEGRYGFVSPHG